MTKKRMEERIAQLEKTVMELQSQLLTLSLRGYITVTPQPNSVPVVVPNTTPPWPPYLPYVGDVPGTYPTVTCGTQTSAIKAQQRQNQ